MRYAGLFNHFERVEDRLIGAEDVLQGIRQALAKWRKPAALSGLQVGEVGT